MVRDILERSVRVLKKHYGFRNSIEILIAILYWKVLGESILSNENINKERLIQIISNLVKKESNKSEIGITLLSRLKSMNEDAIKDIKNIIQFVYSIQLISSEAKQNLLNEFIEIVSFNNKSGFDYFTPPEIIELMKSNTKDDFNSFYDPYKRSGEFLINAYKASNDSESLIVGRGDKPILNQIQELRKVIFEVNVSFENFKESNNKFDLIITNPPFGRNEDLIYDTAGAWDNYITSKRNEFQFLKHCLNKVSDNGKLVIVLPDSFLFSNELKKFREKVITDNYIKKIILLPKVFYGTSVYTCIVEFCFKSSIKDTVEVIDLRESALKKRNREVISNEIIQEINNPNFQKSNNKKQYRAFNYQDFRKNHFDFHFIKEVPEIAQDIDFNIELEKLIKERKLIIKQLKESQDRLNKII